MVATFEAFAGVDRALVFGLGGGGDVVSAVPTARLLEGFGTDVTLGGVSWIPAPRDERRGPRSIAELSRIDRIDDRVAVVSSDAATIDGVSLPEAGVDRHVDNRTLVFDMSAGARPVADSVATIVDRWGVEAVIGVDAGGDALAVGGEPGIRSPLTDAVGLTILDAVDVPAGMGVIGFGSDGELTRNELLEAFSDLADDGAMLGAWGITPRIREELSAILDDVTTEASRLPVDAARGAYGRRRVREGTASVEVGPSTPVTYYFDPNAVIDRSEIVPLVRDAPDLETAASRLRDRGIQTEFDTERARLEGT